MVPERVTAACNIRPKTYGYLHEVTALRMPTRFDQSDSCDRSDAAIHSVRATPETIRWGHFDNAAEPVCRVESGDIVQLEGVTHHAGDAPSYMMDDAVRDIYEAIPPAERGPGSHIVTGPVYVKDAAPGDVLECRVLDLSPRLPHGSNLTASWGRLSEDFDGAEYVTVYEVDDRAGTAEAVFQYEYPGEYTQAGAVTDPEAVDRASVLDGVRVPARYHFGTAGVAPAESGPVDSVPPAVYGGNIDNRHFGVGTSMYYPVQVAGALFTAGDPHLAEGDGEISGTAIEAHLNGVFQFVVHEDLDVTTPTLETDSHWMTHAFDRDLDEAVREAALAMLDFLEANAGLAPPEAYSLLSVAADFHTTQVVNGEQGIHCKLPKAVLPPNR